MLRQEYEYANTELALILVHNFLYLADNTRSLEAYERVTTKILGHKKKNNVVFSFLFS